MDEIAQILETELQPVQSVPPAEPLSHGSRFEAENTVITLDLQCRLSRESHKETCDIKVSLPSDSVTCGMVKMEPKATAAPVTAKERCPPLSEAMSYYPSSEVLTLHSLVCPGVSAAKSSQLSTAPSDAAASSSSEEVTYAVLSEAVTCRSLSEAVTYSETSQAKTSFMVPDTSISSTASVMCQLPSKAVTCAAPLESVTCALPLEVMTSVTSEAMTSPAPSESLFYQSTSSPKAITSCVPTEEVTCLTSPHVVKFADLRVVLERLKIEAVPEPCTSSDVTTNSLEISELSKTDSTAAAVSLREPCTVPSDTSTKSSVPETEVAVTAFEQDKACTVFSDPTSTSVVKLELLKAEAPVMAVAPCGPCTKPSDISESLSVKSEPTEAELPLSDIELQDANDTESRVTETLCESATAQSELTQPQSVTIPAEEHNTGELDVGAVKCEAVQLDEVMPFLQHTDHGQFAVIAVIPRSSITSVSNVLTAVHDTISRSLASTASTTVISDCGSVTSVSNIVTHESSSLTSLSSIVTPVSSIMTSVPSIVTRESSIVTPMSSIVTLTPSVLTHMSNTLNSMHNTVTSVSSITTSMSGSVTSVMNTVTSLSTSVNQMMNTVKSVPSIVTSVLPLADLPNTITSVFTSLHNKNKFATSTVTSRLNTVTLLSSSVMSVSSSITPVTYSVTCRPNTVVHVSSSVMSLSNNETGMSMNKVTVTSASLVSLSGSSDNTATAAHNVISSTLPDRCETTYHKFVVSAAGDNAHLSSPHTSSCHVTPRLSRVAVTATCGSRARVMSIDDSMSEDELHIVLHDDSFSVSESAADGSLQVSLPTEKSPAVFDQPAGDVLPTSVPNDESLSVSDNANRSLRDSMCAVLDSSINKCRSEQLTVSSADSSSASLMPCVADIFAEMSLFCPLSPIPNCQHCRLCDSHSAGGDSRVIILRKRTVTKRKLSEHSDEDTVVPAKVSTPSNHDFLYVCLFVLCICFAVFPNCTMQTLYMLSQSL